MDMQELKSLIYQGEKVDIECKKAESAVKRTAAVPKKCRRVPKLNI